uniref:Uncharacterized protein n=1 Tax=Rhinopithecus bieti TaxID=61621 RepID=A0A2K6LW43_RHIBE
MLIGLPIIYIWPDFYILISKNHQIFKIENNFERNSVNVENKMKYRIYN